MNKRTLNGIISLISLWLILSGASARADAIIADHQATAAFELIPESYINQVKSDCKIFYGRL
jgi:hypothetical protein